MRARKYVVALFIILLILLAVSVALNVYLFTFSRAYYLQLNSVRLDPLGLDYFANETQHLAPSDAETRLVVFFGDSRAAEWPLPSVGGFAFANRGIGAQTSAQVLQRYAAHIEPLQPDVLVVQVCINDLKTVPLFPQGKTTIVANCKENIAQIVERAREQETIVIVSTIFPVGHAPVARRFFWSEDIALAVNEVNSFIHSLAGEQVIVFDAFAILADENGRLVEVYGRDELHLNTLGYEALNQEIEVVVESLHE